MDSNLNGQDRAQSPPSIWDYNPHGAGPLERTPRHDTTGSYSDSDADYSRQNSMYFTNIDPVLLQGSSYPASMLVTASPDELPTTASSPALLSHHNYPPAQPIECATDKNGDYFFRTNPSHPHYPVRHEKQSAYAPQIQGQDPDPNVNDFANLPPNRDGSREAILGAAIPSDAGLSLYMCSFCEIGFGRVTDLKRHMETSTKHGEPRGPACTEPGCKYTRNFTRVDNFRAHYRKQHRKTEDEVDAFLEAWKPGEVVRSEGEERAFLCL
ncbi:hypothetical protein HOY82DRAFT_595120 [Tuber indicum]|nr:hypothetical protein HOY82DRAFT_595120 [Tuber indicum]